MGIVKVLKRKDGASLVVGIALGQFLFALCNGVTSQLSQKIITAGTKGMSVAPGWRLAYLQPITIFVLELVALEVAIWAYVAIHNAVSRK